MLPIPTISKSRRNFPSVSELRERRFFHHQTMNYTLKELQQRVNKLIEVQGEDAHCAAWIYTKEDCHLKDENGEFDYDNVVEDPLIVNRIMDEVGNIDYIYQVIQESVDEVTEEQLVQYQQELEDESPLVQ